MGLFDKFKQGLTKTRNLLNTDVRDLFKKEGRLIDEQFLRELREVLLKTDMGVQAAQDVTDHIAKEFRGRVVFFGDILKVVKERFAELLAQQEESIRWAEAGPTVVMVAGVNGAGKTTSIAKLTHHFRSQGKSVVLGAGDTFRAAAVEQLTIWAERTGAELVRGEHGVDPASVAHRAVSKAVELKADVCIVDTAGRLHTNQNLMEELRKIHRVIGKVIPEAPHEVLLVLDATSGQTAVRQAANFTEYVNCTGIVLAKLDGTAKGGVVIPIRQQFNLPVKFVGVGEGAEDLIPFQVDWFVDALFEGLSKEE